MDIVRRSAKFAHKVAVLKDATSTTYGQILTASEDVARLLSKHAQASSRGSPHGPRIGLVAAPGPEYVAATWAIWQAGGIAVPLATSHPARELQYVLEDAGISQVLTPRSHVDLVKDVSAAHGSALHILPELGTPLTSGSAPTQQASSSATGPAGEQQQQPLLASSSSAAELDSGALIMYTSGTTGKPKGVLHTHRSVEAQVRCLLQAWGWRGSDTILHSLPLHHTHGIINALYCAHAAGATVHFMGKFSPAAVWANIMEGTTSVFMGVPTMYARLLEAYDAMGPEQQRAAAAAAAALRLTISGSSACPLPIMQRWQQLSGTPLLERYGMTEIGMALSNPLQGERRPGFVGLPLPGVEVKVDCVAGVEPPVGELLVRGANLFQGYWGRDEATAECFTQDGFFRTGDSATLAGSPLYYQLLGRTSVDIIKRGGYKISALHIESVLLEHRGLAEVAVLGLPDEVYGERIVAMIATRQGSSQQGQQQRQQQGQQQGQQGQQQGSPSDEDLKTFCRERLPLYQVPQAFVRVQAIPRNAMGKVNKKQLAKELMGQS